MKVADKRARVLIVEDDSSLGYMYRSALRLEGFEVDYASDGVLALQRMELRPPDLVVLDLHLPILSGEAILKEIAENPALRNTPVIVVTGADVQKAVVQATAILRKPCAPDRLLSVIERHLAAAA